MKQIYTSTLLALLAISVAACGGRVLPCVVDDGAPPSTPEEVPPEDDDPPPQDDDPPPQDDDPPPEDDTSPWRLIWADEFNGPAGTRPDPSSWTAEIGGHGWGNNELQFYTDRPTNASLNGNGHLEIVARRESFGGRDYTSARLITRHHFERAYGRFEARLKLPQGQGIWPAFWLLGANYETEIWPACGEIDIMEQRGQAPEIIHGSLHGPGYSAGESFTGSHFVGGINPAVGFHLYAIEWRPGRIEWYLDDVLYFAMNSSDVRARGPWVYDHPFFMILNVAVGGNFVGSPNAATQFPQALVADYVRVYEAKR